MFRTKPSKSQHKNIYKVFKRKKKNSTHDLKKLTILMTIPINSAVKNQLTAIYRVC